MSELRAAPPEPQNATYAYVGAFVDELHRSGLRHVVICPGSRSTPLALTFVAHPQIRCWMHVDERSAAFFALGLAKRLSNPVALLCTSGTAAANFFPAIVEANLTHVPLLVLTADRPPELRECGAPQAIDQNHLYGAHVKWYVETALPEANNASLRYIRTIADRVLARTRGTPAGPVHVNLPLREPLTPAPTPDQPLPPIEQRDSLAWQGRPAGQPYTEVLWPEDASIEGLCGDLMDAMRTSPRGLIIVGPQTDPELGDLLTLLARKTGYPVLADPLSQLRMQTRHEQDLRIASYDAFLHNERFCARYAPQLILRFGAMPTSKALLLYLKQHANICKQIIVDPHHGWDEPTQLAAQIFYTEAKRLCRGLTDMLDYPQMRHTEKEQRQTSQECEGQREHKTWADAWLQADRVTRAAFSAAIGDFTELFEGRVFTELAEQAEQLPTWSLLYVGNSMPVRDMDTFFWPRTRAPLCLGNRGANGIDGVISSALGASAAGGADTSAVLVIGDLSFYHDLNGLLAARLHDLNLTIILVNNNGGGIFSFLPQAAYPEHFEQLFGTPTNLDFRPAVEMYGGIFQRVSNWSDFQYALHEGVSMGGLHVIEVPTERESNVRMHHQLWQVVEQALMDAELLVESEA